MHQREKLLLHFTGRIKTTVLVANWAEEIVRINIQNIFCNIWLFMSKTLLGTPSKWKLHSWNSSLFFENQFIEKINELIDQFHKFVKIITVPDKVSQCKIEKLVKIIWHDILAPSGGEILSKICTMFLSYSRNISKTF